MCYVATSLWLSSASASSPDGDGESTGPHAAGVLCNESTAEQIAATGLVETLFGHMGAKKDDDEFVLQLTFTFSKLLSFEATAAALLQNTDILYYLVDLLQDKNKEVRGPDAALLPCATPLAAYF